MYIESAQNPRVKRWKQLKTRKGRDASHAFLAEGIRLVEEILHSDYRVEALLWDVASVELPKTIVEHPKCKNICFELSPSSFSEISDTVTSQGVIAVVQLPDERRDGATSDLVVLLDGVHDPGNVGTLIRSCDGFGFQGVCCGTNTADPFSPKAVRATMGGLFRLIVSVDESPVFIHRWLEYYPSGHIIVADAHAEIPCFEADLTGPCILVVGSEAFGVSDSVLQLATTRISIPMSLQAESLNAAIAGSVLLYESARQRLRLSRDTI